MMCPEMEVRLNEYVDGLLSPAERQAVEQHVAGCAGCREAVAKLRALLAEAAGLPRSIKPGRDLWPGIGDRIAGSREAGSGKRWWSAAAFWGGGGALAAAAVFLLALGIYRLTVVAPVRRVAVPPGGGLVAAAEYEQAVEELTRTLEAQQRSVRPETVAVIERNLGIIDQAIRESREALAHDPRNRALTQLVSAAYQQKVDLLRWVTRLSTSS